MRGRLSFRSGSEGTPADSSMTTSPNHRLAGEVNLFRVFSTLLHRKRVIGYVSLGSILFATAITLLISNKFQSTASILPSGNVDKMAELKSLAGLGNLGGTDENSSELFPVIIQSRTICDAVLDKTYTIESDGKTRTVTLGEYFDQADPDKLREALRQVTSVSTDKKTGVIGLGVETTSPALSRAVLETYLNELENFNLHKRRSEARERVAYLNRELESRRKELEVTEDSLAAFQSANQNWAATTDPTILKMLTRLQRAVETKNTTYLYLMQELEVAKLDVQKDTPIMRVLDKPSLPTVKSSPHRSIIILMSGMAAFVLTTFVVLGLAALQDEGKNVDPDGYRSFRREFRTAFPRTSGFIGRRFHIVAKEEDVVG